MCMKWVRGDKVLAGDKDKIYKKEKTMHRCLIFTTAKGAMGLKIKRQQRKEGKEICIKSYNEALGRIRQVGSCNKNKKK